MKRSSTEVGRYLDAAEEDTGAVADTAVAAAAAAAAPPPPPPPPLPPRVTVTESAVAPPVSII